MSTTPKGETLFTISSRGIPSMSTTHKGETMCTTHKGETSL
jgi:hypothetical protein